MKIVGGLKRKERVYPKKLVRTTVLDGEHRGHANATGFFFCSSPLTPSWLMFWLCRPSVHDSIPGVHRACRTSRIEQVIMSAAPHQTFDALATLEATRVRRSLSLRA